MPLNLVKSTHEGDWLHFTIRSGVPPSTLKNILYGQSKNVGVVTIKKLCDGLEITIPEFFGDSIFAELEPEL
jgi:hypothetical protein